MERLKIAIVTESDRTAATEIMAIIETVLSSAGITVCTDRADPLAQEKRVLVSTPEGLSGLGPATTGAKLMDS